MPEELEGNEFKHACGCIEVAVDVPGGIRTHFSKHCDSHPEQKCTQKEHEYTFSISDQCSKCGARCDD